MTEAVANQPSGRDLLAPPAAGQLPGSNAGVTLLTVGALVAGCFGALMITPATMGVGLICGGCLLAVMGRIAQAGYQHTQILYVLRRKG